MRRFDYSFLKDKAWDNEIVGYLSQIHELKGKQVLYLRQKPADATKLVEIAKIQSTESSNEIEGIRTTDTRLRQLMSEKTTPRTRDEKEIAGYHRLKVILKAAGLPDIRFHDLRHTFATTALEHGMDVKTLSTNIGHISSATTIDIYSHIIGAMQQQAAQKIEHGIGHSEAFEPHETLQDQLPAEDGKPPVNPPFAPYKGKVRKPGTGGIYELNGHLFEGRYSPTNAHGKREVHTVYAKTKEECEVLLEQMIAEVQEQIKEEKRHMKESTTAGR